MPLAILGAEIDIITPPKMVLEFESILKASPDVSISTHKSSHRASCLRKCISFVHSNGMNGCRETRIHSSSALIVVWYRLDTKVTAIYTQMLTMAGLPVTNPTI